MKFEGNVFWHLEDKANINTLHEAEPAFYE